MFGIRRAALVATTAILGTALAGGAALAAFAPAQDSAQVVAGPNTDNGGRIKSVLEALVLRNVITRGQADAILAALNEARPDRTHEGFLKRVLSGLFEQSATYLGTTPADLRAKLPGTSLGAIADTTAGKSKAGLTDHLTRVTNAALDKAVADAKLTAAQAERAKAAAPDAIKKFVEQTWRAKSHGQMKKLERPAAPKVKAAR